MIYLSKSTNAKSQNHIGPKLVASKIYTTKKEEKSLISQNINSTTLTNQQKAKDAIEIIHTNKTTKNYFSQIDALNDIIAPSFYDISSNKSTVGKTIGKIQEGNKTKYRFALYDIEKNDFNYSGLDLTGTIVVGENSGIIVKKENEKTISITIKTSQKPNMIAKMQNPLLFFKKTQPSLNYNWINTLNSITEIKKQEHQNQNGEQVTTFLLTEEILQQMPLHKKILLIENLTTSGPVKKIIEKQYMAETIHNEAEYSQPPHPIISAISFTKSIGELTFGFFKSVASFKYQKLTSTKGKTETAEAVKKPLKILAKTLHLDNFVKNIKGLNKKGKIIYILSRPLVIALTPLWPIDTKIDTKIIKKLAINTIDEKEKTKKIINNNEKKSIQKSSQLTKHQNHMSTIINKRNQKKASKNNGINYS